MKFTFNLNKKEYNMNRAKMFSLTAGFVLATIFIFSCSSDDGREDGGSSSSTEGGGQGGGSSSSIGGSQGSNSSSSSMPSSVSGSNLSDMPTEPIYFIGWDSDSYVKIKELEIYEGNGDIIVPIPIDIIDDMFCSGGRCECIRNDGVIYECEYEYRDNAILVGKIQNGQVILNLPANINSKYLQKLKFNSDEYCQSTVSVVPENLLSIENEVDIVDLYVTIPGKGNYSIQPYLKTTTVPGGFAGLSYFSESGKITGTQTCTRSGYTRQRDYDMNFSKGWNFIYNVIYDSNENVYFIADFSERDGTWQWGLSEQGD